MKLLKYVGAVRYPFTTTGALPETLIYVEPDTPSEVVSVSDEDATALTARDPALWEELKSTPIPPAKSIQAED